MEQWNLYTTRSTSNTAIQCQHFVTCVVIGE